jgi:hypothetical protein
LAGTRGHRVLFSNHRNPLDLDPEIQNLRLRQASYLPRLPPSPPFVSGSDRTTFKCTLSTFSVNPPLLSDRKPYHGDGPTQTFWGLDFTLRRRLCSSRTISLYYIFGLTWFSVFAVDHILRLILSHIFLGSS